jgi:methylglutaconyl-CoA hydratase
VLDRPDKRNALDRTLVEALAEALDRCADDPAVRVVAISGAGRDFCAGADLEALAGMLDAPPSAHHDDAAALGAVFLRLRALPVPTVALVRGRALAGGAGLATACDIVVADEAAEFGYPEVRVGFVPAMVMTMLRRSVGERRAADLVLTGRRLGAREAEAWGLVSRVLPTAQFDDEAERLLAGMARQPAEAVTRTKALLYALDGEPFAAGIARGVEANVAARATTAFREGVQAFVRPLDGRAP